MSLAEEMLSTMSASDDSSTYLEEEPHIVINESRIAVVPAELKTIAVTGDKDIETVTFDCVRYWDGNDLSSFAIYLNYVLPDGTAGTYIPDSVIASDVEDVFHFDWKIKSNITQKSGKISFAITAIKTKQNESGETVVDKQWSSIPNGDCSIALGLDISNVPDEEESSDILAQMSAILEQIHANVDEWIDTVVVQGTGTSQTQVMSQDATTNAILISKEESIEYTNKKSSELDIKILKNSNFVSRNTDRINKNSKRITNLEKGIVPSPYETDSTVARVKVVPENALSYALLQKVGGMSYAGDFAGLRSAAVTEVVSNGTNLWDKGDVSGIGTKSVNINLPAGTYTFSSIATSADTESTVSRVIVIFADGEQLILRVGRGERVYKSFTASTDIKQFYFNAATDSGTSTGDSFSFTDIMLTWGDDALPYEPYKEGITFPIPADVQSLDGYGLGVNADYNNHIGWEDDGNAKWNRLCGKRAYQAGDEDLEDVVTDGSTETVYILDTPEITDISDLITLDNIIEVTGNGVIEFKNQYNLAPASTVTYQTKEETV